MSHDSRDGVEGVPVIEHPQRTTSRRLSGDRQQRFSSRNLQLHEIVSNTSPRQLKVQGRSIRSVLPQSGSRMKQRSLTESRETMQQLSCATAQAQHCSQWQQLSDLLIKHNPNSSRRREIANRTQKQASTAWPTGRGSSGKHCTVASDRQQEQA